MHQDDLKRMLTTATVAVLLVSLGGALIVVLRSGDARPGPRPARSTLIKRGPHVSAALQPFAFAAPPRGARPRRAGVISCNRPGRSNHVANCKSDGSPAVEPWIVTHGGVLYAAAGDYDTWNGQAGLGFYWSRDGRTWFDGGPIDLFTHVISGAEGDPVLAVDPAGVVYYSGIHFSFTDCGIGGVELLRRDPRTGSWRLTQIAADSETALQDRPSLSVDRRTVFFAWTSFASCTGERGASQVRVALLPAGSRPTRATTVLDAPGSRFSEGPSIGTDGHGGFWIAWEEYPSADAQNGAILLAHWSPTIGWIGPRTISPSGFRDLPDPLPGFSFATSSTPELAVVKGRPWVAWASADGGVGRVSLWSPSGLMTVDGRGGDQLMPALAADGHGGLAIAFSEVDRNRLQRLLRVGGQTTVVSTAPSYPNRDVFFSGKFIGDYDGMTLFAGAPVQVWTDLRVGPADVVTPSAMTGR
jgi:hypothetical protein